jgi:hypothetical protein
MGDWPAHQVREVAWKQAYRSGPREDCMLTTVTVHLPPHIGAVPLILDGRTLASIEEAPRTDSWRGPPR